jgi:hypothetical protein
MRFSQVIFSILPLAITCLALPTPSHGSISLRQSVPAAIFPSPSTSQPAGSTLVQVGFDGSLNYNFVASNSQSSAQIFSLLPQGIAYGLSIATSAVVMESLRPLDTSASLGYTTTLARFWIPSGQVSAFRLGIQTASSRFYSNTNASVKSLMGRINPSITTTV